MKAMAATLDTLKIVDARPKPAEMARDLREGKMQLSMETALALRQFGFLLTQSGRILASDGEMTVEMANGVAYQIRFGDVATTSSDVGKASGGRYLFVTTSWDAARASGSAWPRRVTIKGCSRRSPALASRVRMKAALW